ncbi:MAG: nucleoside hydrolase [Bacteroidota bacterium]
MNKAKILLDTDIGTDVDDAVCLAYLLSHPECDLLGITTVTRDAHKRAMLASPVCLHAGREVPIYPGVELPMVVGLKQRVAQQGCSQSFLEIFLFFIIFLLAPSKKRQ